MISIMKVMIPRQNINIQYINKESFFTLFNNNFSPVNGASIWNVKIFINNILYGFSFENLIKYSEISSVPNLYIKN